jgi:hypothetical protein
VDNYIDMREREREREKEGGRDRDCFIKEFAESCWVLVVHTCNPSYSEGRD